MLHDERAHRRRGELRRRRELGRADARRPRMHGSGGERVVEHRLGLARTRAVHAPGHRELRMNARRAAPRGGSNMRISVKLAVAVAVTAAALPSFATQAAADAVKCERTIAKEAARYRATAATVIGRCKETVVTKTGGTP